MKTRYKLFTIFAFISLFYGCRNYESEKYIAIENEAISDIIIQLTNYEWIKNDDDFDTNHLKLFLISSLFISGYEIYEIPTFTEYVNTSGLTDSEMKEYKEDYEKLYKRFKEEQKVFAPLIKGRLKERILDYKFEYSNVEVVFVDSISCWEIKQNELGYLDISRIIFNRRFDKGYLSYDLFFGDGSHGGHIEIVKINNKWKVSRIFSEWVA